MATFDSLTIIVLTTRHAIALFTTLQFINCFTFDFGLISLRNTSRIVLVLIQTKVYVVSLGSRGILARGN